MTERYIVAGGGVTGLRLAYLLAKQGMQVTVISSDIGGLIQSHQDEGFYFDYGGHVYTTQDAVLDDIMTKAGAIRQARSAFYFSQKTEWVPYPVQDHADQLGLKVEKSMLKPSLDADLKTWGLATFGKEFYQKFFAPFNRRVWTMAPEKMASDWINTRVKQPMEDKKDWGPNALFQYAPGRNIIKVLKEMAKEQGAKFISADITGFSLQDKELLGAYPTSGSRVRVGYDTLYWTLPLRMLASEVDIDPSQFMSNRVRTIGIGFHDSFIHNHFHWGYGDLKSPIHRITWLSRYHPSLAPEGKDSLLLEMMYRLPDKLPPPFAVGGIRCDNTLPHIDNTLIHRGAAVRALYAAGFKSLKAHHILTAVMGDTMGYPIPTLGIRHLVARTKRLLLEHDVITAGRWGSWGYFNLQHCLADALCAAHNVFDDRWEPTQEYLYSTFYYRGYE